MANTIAIQTLQDGPKYTVLKAYLASDGASGEVSNQVIFDASAVQGAPTDCTISKVWVSTTGCAFNLAFDATTDVVAASFPADVVEDLCFDKFGGLANNAGTGKTGDILLNTTGFTAAGDQITVVLVVKKD